MVNRGGKDWPTGYRGLVWFQLAVLSRGLMDVGFLGSVLGIERRMKAFGSGQAQPK